MKGSRTETILGDVCQSPHGAGMPHAKEVEVVRVIAEMCEYGNSVKGRTVMVQLAFDAGQLAPVNEIPVPAGTAVVAPMGHGRHVRQNGVECNHGFVVKSEITGP